MSTLRCILLTVLLLPSAASSQAHVGLLAPLDEIPLTSPARLGARSLGMGGTAIAVADDASAIGANPAALARLRRIEISGGIIRSTDGLSGTAFGSEFDTRLSSTSFSSLRFAYPVPTFRGSLVLGLSADRAYSFDDDFVAAYTGDYQWGENYGDLQDSVAVWDRVEDYVAGGAIYAWNFAAAFDASESVSLGAALTYYSGNYTRTFRFRAEDVNDESDNYDTHILYTTDDVDASGLRATVGAIVYLGEQVSCGVVVKSPTKLTFNVVESVSRVAEGPGGYDDEETIGYENEVELPFSFSGGIAFSPTDLVMLAADLCYTDWSELRYDGERVYLGDVEERVDAYRPVLDYSLGAEVSVPDWPLRVRAGYMSRPIAYEGLAVDRDRSYLTLGAGVLVDTVFSLDIAWMGAAFERSGEGFAYEESVNDNAFLLEAAYRF